MSNLVIDVASSREFSPMVSIPAGWFVRGSESGSSAESPAGDVYLREFLIDATLVTNTQFAAFVGETDYRTTAESARSAIATHSATVESTTWRAFASPDRSHHPVVCVSWVDASAFAAWQGKRLPTEAEWEKAARGGLADALYPWGSSEPTSEVNHWLPEGPGGSFPLTSSVGVYPPNPYGVFDAVGNVWQWCADWYDAAYYLSTVDIDPTGPVSGQYRTRRGGAWNVRESFRLRCANRGAMPPGQSWPNLGFRCVKSGDARSQ